MLIKSIRYGTAAMLLLASTAGAATLSTNLGDYVLFAIEELHTKRLVLTHGDVGVNDPTRGRIISKGPFDAPNSVVGAHEVRFNNKNPQCSGLVANETHGTDAGCTDPTPFAAPIADVAAACAYPTPFPACDPGRPISVRAGETIILTPGVYGSLDLEGGPRGFGTVVLSGEYVFCDVATGRDAAIEFGGPSTVSVVGDMKIGRASAVMNGALDPENVHLFVDGARITVIQNAAVTGVLCAPNAKLTANHGVQLTGRYIARDIRLKKSAVQGSAGPECTTDADCEDGEVCVGGACVPGSCNDGIQNGAETDVDCGGGECPTCPDGGGCQTDSDCQSGNCVDGTCQPVPPTCSDGIQNGAETDVDCGGGTCPTCPDGGGCQTGSDCDSGVCVDGVCQPASCTDGIRNGAETDVDCGGGECPTCPDGGGCQTDSDCESGVCVDGTCQPVGPTCTDGIQNGTETDVDCGGGACPACPDGGGCQTGSDCDSGVCVDGICQPASCTDGIRNGTETDVDCGGGTCPTCPDGGGCQTDSDCQSGVCIDGMCVAPTCMDGRRNGHETDVDCGGDECPGCPDGGGCDRDEDCQSGICVDGVCQPIPPTCTDGIQNGTETDVDCGGDACPTCPDGGGCQTDSDCESGVCIDGVCQPATCTDGVQNGTETDVDCGGDACPRCPTGGGCLTDDDCESGRCVDGVCIPNEGSCGNGIIEGDEVCDGDVPCDESSPMGAMILCAEDCLSIIDFQCLGDVEVCGDCIDNDADGMVDLDDPECGCDDTAQMSLTKVRVRMNERPRVIKRLKVQGIWAAALPDGFDPREHGTQLQLNDDSGTIYCANFEAANWREKDRRRLVYKAPIRKPRVSKPSNGLKLARFKVTDDGPVVFKARGPRARVEGDVVGDVTIRVKAGDRCTTSAAALRSKGRRQLVFP